MNKKTLIISIVILILLAGLAFILFGNNKNELAINTSRVSVESIETTIMATGYVQPVEEIEVGTQVSGVIEKIYVDYNSVVRKGQLLAELDKMTLQEKVNQAQASLNSAQSELNYARQNYNRVQDLYQVKAATLVSFEEAQNKLTQAQTSLANAQANLHQAEVNLSYAYIYSPINGVILDRSVNTGQTVAASFNTPTLFTIAEDLTKMQVEADVDEADIGQVRLGQKVTFTVDAFSDMIFTGEVSQIRLQPTVTNNVVTYTVIIEAPNPEEKLYPGMTASVTIITQSETGVTVPMEALNFRPTPEITERLNVNSTSQPSREQQNVWVKEGENITQRPITTGINDGINTIVTSGLRENEEIILSVSTQNNKKQGQAAANPLMPQRPRR